MQYKNIFSAIKDAFSSKSAQETVIVPINKTDPWAKFKRKKNKKTAKPVGRHSQEYVLANVAPSDYFPEHNGAKKRPRGWSLMLMALYPDRKIDSSTQTLQVLTDEVLNQTATLPFVVVKEAYRPPVSPAPAGAGKYLRKAA